MLRVKTVCTFCSMGCGYYLVTNKGIPSHIEYDQSDPINHGSLCPRGNCSIELVKNHSRLASPKIKIGGTHIEAGWIEAFGYLGSKLGSIIRQHGPKSIGVVVSPGLTNEEIYIAGLLARDVIKTPNFDVAFTADDNNILEGLDGYYVKETPVFTVNDIDDSDCVMIIGDQLSKAPCSSKNIMNSKYAKKGTKVIVLEPRTSNTAWFATRHIRMKPGTEWLVLAGLISAVLAKKKNLSSREGAVKRIFGRCVPDDISRRTGVPLQIISAAADEFAASKKATIVLASGYGRMHPMTAVLAKVLASVSGGRKGILPFYTHMNASGAYHIYKRFKTSGNTLSGPRMIEEAVSGGIRGIISFGADLISMAKWGNIADKNLKLDMLAVSDIFPTRTTAVADVVLPSVSIAEKSGSIALGDNSVLNIEDHIRPISGSKSDFDIIERIMLALGKKESEVKKMLSGSDHANKRKSGQRTMNDLDKMLKHDLAVAISSGGRQYVLVPDEDIVHHAEGSYSKRFEWAKRICPEPVLNINLKNAKELGIKHGDYVVVRSKNGELITAVRITDKVPDRTVFAPAHFMNVRNLFGRNINLRTGRTEIGPADVTIKRMEQ